MNYFPRIRALRIGKLAIGALALVGGWVILTWLFTLPAPFDMRSTEKSMPPVVARVALGIVILVLFLKVIPQYQIAGHDKLSQSERLTLENAARQTLVQIMGGAILLAGAVSAWTQFLFQSNATRETLRVAQETQITERFTKAVEQLGSDKREVRLGGIYALERIARESPPDHAATIELLAAFIRAHAGRKASPDQRFADESRTALAVIGRRDDTHEAGDSFAYWNLSDTNLSGFELAALQFAHVTFSRGLLVGADANLANLRDADLRGVTANTARFDNASMVGAYLWDAEVRCASFLNTNLSGAQLQRADFTGANLNRADLESAVLMEVGLAHGRLSGANLKGAFLTRADLRYADLSDLRSWQDIRKIDLANIYGVRNAPARFSDWAKREGAVSAKSDTEWKQLMVSSNWESRIYPPLTEPCPQGGFGIRRSFVGRFRALTAMQRVRVNAPRGSTAGGDVEFAVTVGEDRTKEQSSGKK